MLLLLCYVDPLGVIVWSCALCGSAPLSVSAAYYCVMVNMVPATDRTGPLLYTFFKRAVLRQKVPS